MSSFKNSPELYKKIDYQIVANGWFQLYLSNTILGNDIEWLENEGYEIVQFKCNSESKLFEQFREQFLFPKYFHHNLNSLNDCLRDIEIKGIGMAIVFKNADSLKKDILDRVLDIFVNMARLNFIIGKRVLILVQVNNNDFKADDIGSIKATWNINEWLDSKRR
ncbi:barstar family protein [Flavobacterium sharifuzzamanii]|uniref:barstar family protein n=1 Tax=Flavobacterium sharifuzzamanii TaxID=2211133 RepID=UPI000DABA3ED|nr:barstar family protein [Flavobacterium sharifuzzamanii]KAF2082701.1 barstar family protein [Flavobacterium sharifuzzamanii]